ncbi:signal recognition particle subunit SRP68-like [Hyalella azteca]|uniref:Signal recognition particle subunit SRP68 n=1 Tax=Hyalella azteca TaxID=294128 RepID=A0A8B7NPP9_HYAAZ|nr:signal recognition particle subunit SRP68-like [Hyalella azteca]
MVQHAADANLLSLRVLRVAHEARMCHGLRHKDYQMYRQYCSRRIRRLRKRFDIRQGEKKYRKRELQPAAIKEEKMLELPLLMAERYWAYAMQLKEESMQDPRKKFALRNKLRKAATYSVNFEKIVEACGKCDARTQLEVQGYSAWLQGTVLFELAEWTQQWDAPVVFFNKAIAIYSKLSEAVTEEEAGIIKALVSEVEVQLRYCRHHLGDKAATSSLLAMTDDTALGEKLDVLVSQAREKQAATLSEVTWRGRTLSVKQEKVRLFLLKESESAGRARYGDRFNQLDKLLMECKDAIALVRDDLNNDPTFKTRQAANSGPVSSGHFLYSYLCYLRLRLTLARNVALLTQYSAIIAGKTSAAKGSKVPRDQDVVRLCDLSMQNLNEMCQLAGLEDDLELKQENDSKIAYFKALRCFHVAESYAKQEKWVEAMTLYKRAEERIAQAKSQPNLQSSDEASLEALAEQLAGLSVTVKARALLPSTSTTPHPSPSQAIKKPLSERMDEYLEDQCLLNHTNPRVLPMPPSLSAVPCKPLFFDLALSHVAFPSLEKCVPTPEQPSPAQQKAAQQPGGLSSIVKGLWGWGSKK